jgi:hypothetical protein
MPFLVSESLNLHYLNLPIGYRLIPDFSLLAGAEVGYLLNGKTIAYEQMDYGIALATAYSVTEKISVELRYTYGFAPLLKVELRDYNNAPAGEFRDGYNRLLQLSVLYFLN